MGSATREEEKEGREKHKKKLQSMKKNHCGILKGNRSDEAEKTRQLYMLIQIYIGLRDSPRIHRLYEFQPLLNDTKKK